MFCIEAWLTYPIAARTGHAVCDNFRHSLLVQWIGLVLNAFHAESFHAGPFQQNQFVSARFLDNILCAFFQ